MNKNKSGFYKVLEIIFIIIFVIALINLIKIGLKYYNGRKFYNETKKEYVNSEEPFPHYPVDLNSLQQENSDVVGWIHIKDTPVDYPILWSNNNNTYLRHTYKKDYNVFGSIFIAAENKPDLTDLNTIIYGHNTKDGSMFGTIEKYSKEEYVKEHPFIDIYMPTKAFRYKVVSAYTTESRSLAYELSFDTPKIWEEWYNNIVEKSDFTSDPTFYPTNPIERTGNIITLSTCTNRSPNERFVVHGMLVSVRDRN